jgi:hypothetical protein
MTWLIVAGAVLVLGVAWVVRLAGWPYGPCPRCRRRRGRGMGSTGRGSKRCRGGEIARRGARTVRAAIGKPID